jgi:hypothetical protein
MSEIQIKSIDWLLYNLKRISEQVELILCAGRTGKTPLAGLGGTGGSSGYIQSEVEENIVKVERCRDIVREVKDLLDDENNTELYLVYLHFYELEETYQEIRESFLAAGYRRKVSIRTLIDRVKEIRERVLQRLELNAVTTAEMMYMMDKFGGKTRGKVRN